jgi:hypothetical protein
MPIFYYYRRRRHGALRKDASSGSSLLRLVMRSEAWAALQRPHGIYYLLFQQASARTAFAVGVDAPWRRVACRASLLYIESKAKACPPSVWRACPPSVWRGMGLFERPHLSMAFFHQLKLYHYHLSWKGPTIMISGRI